MHAISPSSAIAFAPSRNSYKAGLGANHKQGAVSIGASYDYVGKSGFDADVFSARVQYACRLLAWYRTNEKAGISRYRPFCPHLAW